MGLGLPPGFDYRQSPSFGLCLVQTLSPAIGAAQWKWGKEGAPNSKWSSPPHSWCEINREETPLP